MHLSVPPNRVGTANGVMTNSIQRSNAGKCRGGAQGRQFAKRDQDGERESRYEQDNG